MGEVGCRHCGIRLRCTAGREKLRAVKGCKYLILFHQASCRTGQGLRNPAVDRSVDEKKTGLVRRNPSQEPERMGNSLFLCQLDSYRDHLLLFRADPDRAGQGRGIVSGIPRFFLLADRRIEERIDVGRKSAVFAAGEKRSGPYCKNDMRMPMIFFMRAATLCDLS